jgi:hypothetical protein
MAEEEGLPVPEFTDPVFVKTSPKRSFSIIVYERFGLDMARAMFYPGNPSGSSPRFQLLFVLKFVIF